MTEAQKYQRKKNFLIISFMVLLVVFVCLICYIFVYTKTHPKKQFVSQDSIEIKNMVIKDYQISTDNLQYSEVTESTAFKVLDNNKEISLVVNEKNEVVKADTGEKIEILLNGTDINNNIKVIYQTFSENLILTTDGKLYRALNNILSKTNKMNVGQILTDITVNNIVRLNVKTDSAYVLTNENKVVSIESKKEYDGIIKELTTSSGVIYVYDDYSFTFEKGKVITDENGNIIKFTNLFENKLVDENSRIYEIDFINKTITTSKLGIMSKIWYVRDENNNYKVTLEANTGYYDFESTHFYSR